jgi:hypothetical protein
MATVVLCAADMSDYIMQSGQQTDMFLFLGHHDMNPFCMRSRSPLGPRAPSRGLLTQVGSCYGECIEQTLSPLRFRCHLLHALTLDSTVAHKGPVCGRGCDHAHVAHVSAWSADQGEGRDATYS